MTRTPMRVDGTRCPCSCELYPSADINKLPVSHKSFQSTYMQYLCELGGFLLGGLIGALCAGALANRCVRALCM